MFLIVDFLFFVFYFSIACYRFDETGFYIDLIIFDVTTLLSLLRVKFERCHNIQPRHAFNILKLILSSDFDCHTCLLFFVSVVSIIL